MLTFCLLPVESSIKAQLPLTGLVSSDKDDISSTPLICMAFGSTVPPETERGVFNPSPLMLVLSTKIVYKK